MAPTKKSSGHSCVPRLLALCASFVFNYAREYGQGGRPECPVKRRTVQQAWLKAKQRGGGAGSRLDPVMAREMLSWWCTTAINEEGQRETPAKEILVSASTEEAIRVVEHEWPEVRVAMLGHCSDRAFIKFCLRCDNNELQYPEMIIPSEEYLEDPEKLDQAIQEREERIEWEGNNLHLDLLEFPMGGEGHGVRTVFGACTQCQAALPVWRECVPCARYLINGGHADIFVHCLRCPEDSHQQELYGHFTCSTCRRHDHFVVSEDTPWEPEEEDQADEPMEE